MNRILNYELLSNLLSNSENFQRGKMWPSSTTSRVTAIACCRNTLCNLLQSASFIACVGQGSGPTHAHPIFPGAMGCWFCVGRMQNCCAAILRGPCMKGNVYPTDRDSSRAEGCNLPYVWVTIFFLLPRQPSGQKKCAILRLPLGNEMYHLSWH